ncbi:Rossmann-like and DUF2520 domain-containing protein [Nesterenkonia xinjiangensis]|uniref:Putative short-subunit dehydrogenase-like oxidoreductase (DUF2520 family) n=1 Tax=Nesterenkonia xinjiangensis TaxID=225327 RepID=A0A7Z0KC14_9MICC|nr:DUF2520 domain-containing protein [Nesterenkonia xinjiangensis]NYJ78187.1 putative short-subunit dehydrogenase-like oxidoreductase (DUF2520 family) [Nesterenkonia xinjiangensis]
MNVVADPYPSGSDPSQRDGRLGVGIISAGKVGVVLGAALRGAGHQVVGVHAVSEDSRSRAESLLDGVPVLQIPEILRRSELVLLAVPDDVLGEVVAGAAEAGHFQPGQLVIHTSGRYGTEVLAAAQRAGAITLAIHPAMTFTGLSMDLQRLSTCAFAVTAPAPVLPIAQALVVEMGGEPVTVAERDRGIYHAALAHASNHLNTITGQSSEMLRRIGVEAPDRVLGPLMQASLDNALSSGEGALTGPIARGDVGTVAHHVQLLSESQLPADVRTAYVHMARATAQRALDRGIITEAQAAEILDALAE